MVWHAFRSIDDPVGSTAMHGGSKAWEASLTGILLLLDRIEA